MAEGRAEGIAEGRAEGIAEGQAQALLRQLRFKFKTVPPQIEHRVAAASPAQLNQWLERVLVAERVEDVIGDE